MRITNSMLTNNLLRNMYVNLRGLERAQDRLSSRKEVRCPSDDPVRVVSSLALRSDLGEVEQFQKNFSDAQAWFEITEGALGNATDVLQRARDLAVYGATDTIPQESRQALANEVRQLQEQLVQIANTTHGGRYIFGGTCTNEAPYAENDQWVGNGNKIEFELASGVMMQVNLPGKELFGDIMNIPDVIEDVDPQAIPVLEKLAEVLENPDKKGTDVSPLIGKIDEVLDQFIAKRGEIGAKVNRMEMSLDRLGQTEVRVTELLSQAEDADIARAIIDLKSQENAYRVTLAAGARIMMPTLIDFLR
ncbi:MAG TPA: flagellar hook-associated protein FlgL [Syntrophomonadaceae bacterium]|nr:flagellar hook-associated protein FlgL [Syntrophomonadaceae bacterium]